MPRVVLLTGVAGLTAGAFAMAAGEFVSVRSQRELFEYQIGLERDELAEYPDAEAQELALIYAAKGLADGRGERARQAARRRSRARARHAGARGARASIPTSWARRGARRSRRFSPSRVGAAIPLLPFVFGAGRARAADRGIADRAGACSRVGATLSLFTGRSALVSGARMLLLGALRRRP